MPDSPQTRATLLLRLRDDNREAWNQFVEIYAPLIHSYGMHHGLQDADAADLAQEVLQSVSGAIKAFEYDPSRGAFRGWLFTVTRNKLRRLAGRAAQEPRGSGDTVANEMLAQQPADVADEEYWTRSHKWRLFHWAAEQVKSGFQEATWKAFWRTSVENASPNVVAAELGLSLGAVYIAKSRVLAKIRELILSVEPE